MIRITQLKLRPGEPEEMLAHSIRKLLHLKEQEEFSYEVLRRSIDARKKPDLFETYTVQVDLKKKQTEKRILHAGIRNVSAYAPVRYRYAETDGKASPSSQIFSDVPKEAVNNPERPLIIGTGPAGLFCGLLLARQGMRPILIERGQRAAQRSQSVLQFWDTGALNPESNVQFGEGGAGTFSDGKLNTGVKDPEGRIRFILETFVQAGAHPDILCDAKPHVGTDVLKKVIACLTDEICSRGGEVFFETRMDQMEQTSEGMWKVGCSQVLREAAGTGNREMLWFTTRHLVLAIGHSARDTFAMLHRSGICMKPKAFAVGVRIQHPQSLVDRALYGISGGNSLPAASYKLTHRLEGGRGVYSFCMCPGGYVVNASSEEGGLAVNGMSNHDRASNSANSAIVVTVSPEEIAAYENHTGDIPALIGMEFQRHLERAAFEAGNGAIPVQRFGDYARRFGDCAKIRLPDYEPKILGRWTLSPIRRIFPEFIASGIEEGILAWERQIEGFSSEDALLCAAESRTSSPVRILREEDYQAPGHRNLYPCGEGAGYAGGITSAAVDGLKVAEQILKTCVRP